MRVHLLHILATATIALAAALPAQAQLSTTFHVRVTAALCPEYKMGGVVMDVFYRIGDTAQLQTPEVLYSQVDAAAGTALYELGLPSFYGPTPLNIVAQCRSARGAGVLSNVLSVSNCQVLAHYDTDADGIPNNEEDTNCDNFFSPGDASNPDNVDSDGDGVRDLVEKVSGTDPTNPGSSPRPFIYSAGKFDPDQDGDANALAWRGGTGTFYIRDFGGPGGYLGLKFGQAGDVPFSYSPAAGQSDVGVVRAQGTQLIWYFNGPGIRQAGEFEHQVPFGLFGDNLVPGPWERPGVTSPAVARLFNGEWTFFILLSDGTVHTQNWGGNGDIAKPGDYDGDGLYDFAVFRPAQQRTYIIRSSDRTLRIFKFGTGTADHTVRGDYSGDGVEDISFWEPATGTFTTMTSENGFDDALARQRDPQHYVELQLGLYNTHLPLNWNWHNGHLLFTVVDHASGTRYYRENNHPSGAIRGMQWGLAGDHQG